MRRGGRSVKMENGRSGVVVTSGNLKGIIIRGAGDENVQGKWKWCSVLVQGIRNICSCLLFYYMWWTMIYDISVGKKNILINGILLMLWKYWKVYLTGS